VEVEEGDSIEEIVENLRERAKLIVGSSAKELYDRKYDVQRAYRELERKLENARKEWDATAEFLRAQGIKPDAPSMPQFTNLLSASKVEAETVLSDAEFVSD